MADDPRSYLLDRFRNDASTLRARAEQLAGKPAPAHGPNADASVHMAEACEHVVMLLSDLSDDVHEQLTTLESLLPELKALAEEAPDGFVRSVYGGAATRLSEIVSKERMADGDGLPDDSKDDMHADDDTDDTDDTDDDDDTDDTDHTDDTDDTDDDDRDADTDDALDDDRNRGHR